MSTLALRTRALGAAVAVTLAGTFVLAPAASAKHDGPAGDERRTTPTTRAANAGNGGGGSNANNTRGRNSDADRESHAPNGANGNLHTDVRGCTLTVILRGFDTGSNRVNITITDKKSGAVLVNDTFTANFPTRTNGNTVQYTKSYTINGTHHVKTVATVTSAKGTARKSKVDWIRCGSAAAAGTGTAAAAGAGSAMVASSETARPAATGTAASTNTRVSGVAATAEAKGRRAAANDDVRVLGTSFERNDPPAFAFTGMGLVRLLTLGAFLVGLGALAVWAARHRRELTL